MKKIKLLITTVVAAFATCISCLLGEVLWDIWTCFSAALETGSWDMFWIDLKVIVQALGG